MALRWATSGVLEAEKGFRRVRGYRDMPALIASLEALCPAVHVETCGVGNEEIA